MRTRSWAFIFQLGWLACWAVTSGSAQISDQSQACLACHGDPDFKEMVVAFKNGRSIPVFLDAKRFQRSVHGSFDCTDCHTSFSDEEHPSRSFDNPRQYRSELSKVCQDCHSFEGIHARLLRQSNLTCVDCHGEHTVQPIDRKAETCLGCHDHELRISLQDGTVHGLSSDRQQFEASVHKKLRCVECHFGFSSRDHPERVFRDRRDLTLALSESCRRCHFDKYTRTLESVHYEILRRDPARAPVCTDCHGSHSIKSGHHDKLTAARRCQGCHPQIYKVYSESIHGKALVSADNQDVPVCSDCHTAHTMKDPRNSDFRNEIPQMCGDCHANEALMSRYGLSTAVLQSYLEDFHGVTVTFYKRETGPQRHIAVCSDCHGIHDIESLRGRDNAAIKAALLERCRQCHAQATENFPDAWLSHYEPTLKRAPLVYFINQFYKILIPFMVVGLALQVLLHIWRYALNR